MENQNQQPKPTKEQIKIALKKIALYQKEQREANKNKEQKTK